MGAAEADHPEVIQVVVEVVDSQRHGQEIVGDNKDQRTQKNMHITKMRDESMHK